MDEEDIISITCKKCSACIAIAKDSDGDPQTVKFHCSCGQLNEYDFLGFPYLGTTDTHFFDFIEEDEYKCHKKK